MKPANLLIAICCILIAPTRVFARIYITAGTDVSTRSYVQFYVEDDLGRRTGQPPTGPEVAEIPGTAGHYGTESIFKEGTGESGPESVEFHISSFPAGHFKLVLLPQITTSYWLLVSIVNDNNASLHQKFFGYGTVASPLIFEFEHHPANASPTPIAKDVSIGGLRQSVIAALQVGQLGDSAFTARLDKMLAKAQSEADSGKNKQAADRLDQFVHRLESAFKKEPDPNDGDDPDDKKNASTMKRFVVKTALDSLSADARILIGGLGEQPKK